MTLMDKMNDRSARIGVIGLGYVGLPLMRAFWDAGFPVIGYDVDPRKIEQLNRGENYLKHLGENLVADMATPGSSGDGGISGGTSGGRFAVTADLGRLGEADAILICVPTPLGRHQDPDLSYVEQTADAVAATLRPGQLIVLESTTYPGTTRDIILPRLEATGLKLGEQFYLAYSPEREDPGRKTHNTQTIPKLVGGIGPASTEAALALYRLAIKQVIPVSSAEVAEAAKLLENIYRAVNVALVNEMKVVLNAMGIDVWEVIEAAATKPFGFQKFTPGPGLGGHCIPIDPFYLTWKAREIGLPTRFIELAGEVNTAMPDYVVSRVATALNDRGKAVKGAKVLVLGLAYKPDVDDVRESPSFELIERLRKLGAAVDYNDPHVPAMHSMRHYPDMPMMKSVELSAQSLAGYDCVVVATDHSAYDWRMIADYAPLIVDSRGALRGIDGNKEHVISA